MASSLLALLDDIATILDDVAVLSKVAAKKTTGVLGDDLALNANQLTGITAEREIPVIIKVAKGSFINKAIIVPVALLISYFIPSLIQPLLMIGGAYLCFEGMEKIIEKLFHKKSNKEVIEEYITNEDEKIKGAIKTDFILSSEIIVITLGTVAAQPIFHQILSLIVISIAMTIGVYGFVAIIIKLDDLGLYFSQSKNKILQTKGLVLLKSAPILLKGLGIIGTIAMFMVGGGILAHGIHLNNLMNYSDLGAMIIEPLFGMTIGTIICLFEMLFHKIKKH